MFLCIKEENYKRTAKQLMCQDFSFVFCEIGHKRGFLCASSNVIDNLKVGVNYPVSLLTVEKISLLEQDMAMRMGRRMGNTRSVMHNYNMRVLDDSLFSLNNPYSIWTLKRS